MMGMQHQPQREPDAQGGPVRRFVDPSYRPLATNLAVAQTLLGAKTGLFRTMARPALVVAPVRELAQRHQPAFNGGFEGLPDVVEAAYRALVAGYIACEQQYFGRTESLADDTTKESEQ